MLIVASRLARSLALAAVLSAGVSLPSRADGASSPSPSDLAPVVSVVTAAERDLVERTIVTGTLVPKDEVLVTPEVDGYQIGVVLVEEGASVVRGQVLARLSHDMLDRQIDKQAALIAKAQSAVNQAQSSIVQADAEHTQTKLSLDRARELLKGGNSTAEVMEGRVAAARSADGRLDFARTGLAIAAADLAQAKAAGAELALKLAQTEIRAPVDGIVSRRAARVGAIASSSGEPLFRLIANGTIELEGDIVETRLPAIRLGQAVKLKLDDGPPVLGQVRLVYPEVDKASRLGKARIALKPDPRLHIGAFAGGRVETARTHGIAVPIAAVLYGDGGSSVLVVRADDTVEARKVRTGLVDGDDIAVTAGLAAGERLVARAGSFLRDGDHIKPVPLRPVAAMAVTPDQVD